MDKKTVDENEYDLESVDTSAFGVNSPRDQLLEKLKGKTVYLVFGVIVTVLIIYKLLSLLFSPSQPKPVAPAIKPVPTVVQPAIQTNQNEFTSKLAILENSTVENRDRLAEGLRTVSRLETNVNSLQSQLNLMNERLQDLTNQLKKQNEPKKKIVKAVVKEFVKRPAYYVQALVPERAWLKQGDGTTITVSRGDELPGYGQISDINVSQGTVTTSKGDIISFHPSDR